MPHPSLALKLADLVADGGQALEGNSDAYLS
jgi:hypothetical protein